MPINRLLSWLTGASTFTLAAAFLLVILAMWLGEVGEALPPVVTIIDAR